MVHLYPVPDAEGIAKTKRLYLDKYGRILTDGEAYEVLNSVMRLIWLTSSPDVVDHGRQQGETSESGSGWT